MDGTVSGARYEELHGGFVAGHRKDFLVLEARLLENLWVVGREAGRCMRRF